MAPAQFVLSSEKPWYLRVIRVRVRANPFAKNKYIQWDKISRSIGWFIDNTPLLGQFLKSKTLVASSQVFHEKSITSQRERLARLSNGCVCPQEHLALAASRIFSYSLNLSSWVDLGPTHPLHSLPFMSAIFKIS